MHFSLIYVFLNTDFGRSGSGREFARKKSLRSKNRIELLTPAAILGFLCATYFFFSAFQFLLWQRNSYRALKIKMLGGIFR